jgi:ribosomal protein S18 acetylase RimI-like enzyme
VGGTAQLIEVRPIDADDHAWVEQIQAASWDGAAARRGELVLLAGLPGFVARLNGERVGLLTYAVRGDECEVVTIESRVEGRGVGRALLDAARGVAEAAGCRRLWLVTSNDNVRALGFYQRWGMDIAAFRRGAIDDSRRRLKPSIPERGTDGVPIAHELELELRLG